MAAGLPILGIDSPGVGDTVKDGISGFLAPDEDLAMFTAKMVRMISDKELRSKMGVQARKNSEMYAIENTTQIMESHYKKIISRASKRKSSLRARLTRLIDRWR
jgi:glycosyltransferase involved in cell wall biosynthesis